MFPFDNRAITWIFLVLVFYVLVDSNKAENEPRVVCYYTNWSVYRPGTAKFNPQNINPYLCTHLIYAFGGFTKDNALKPFDKYQDIEQGGYAKFTGLKTYNKNLKTMLAIGGWNEGSTRFSPLMANKDRRHQFVKNIIKFLRQNHFDGLDLDWEYPAYRDGGKPRDRANYAQFVQELREEFERESSKTGRPRLLLTMAVPAGIEYIEKGYDIPKLNQYLDWFNILSYDYHSAYEPSVNHHSPLYSLEEASEYNYDTELNIDYSVKFYLNAGADRDKIVLGIPTYGRSFTLLNEDATDIGAPADGPGEQGDATREKGYLAYYEICQNLKNDEDWTVIQPNPSAMGPYAFKGNQWVGYDDEDIVRKKSKYVAQNGLGGIMFWSIDNDDFRGSCHGKPYPLIEAAKEALYNALQPGYNEVLSSPTKKPTRPRNRNKSRNKLKEESTTESYTTKRTTTPKYSGGRTTTPPPPTTPDPGSDFKCEDEGFFPHPRDCKKYFWCLDSGPSNLGIVAHQFTCPSGLVFNKATDSCDYTRNVICSKPKSTKAPAIETTTVGRTTTTRRVAITAATSRNSFIKITTKKPTTTTPADEYEYEDDVEDDVGTPKFKVDEEDPKVIKELIDLIKKAGGVEQLEKHLNLQGNSEASEVLTKLKSSTSGSASTSSPIKKSLYDRVLSGRNNNNKGVYSRNRFSSTITEDEKNESSGASEATQRPSYSQINRNSRPQPQNAGLENLQEFDAFIGDKPQYQTIKRTRPTTPATSTIDENEDDDDDDDDDDTQGSNNNYSVRPTSSYSADLNTTPKRRYVSLSRTTLSPTTITDAKEEDDHSTTKYKTIERSRPTTTRSEIQESEPLATPAEVETTVSNLNSNLDSANTTPTQSTRTYAILTRRTTTVSSHDPTTAQQTDDIIITTQSNRDNEADHLDEKFITSIDEIRPSTTQSDIITVTESLPNPIDTEPLDSENNEVKYPKESNGIINTLPSAIASDSINQLVNINNFNDGVNSQFNSTESKLIIGNENDVLNATGAVVSKISNLINDIIVNTSNTGSSLTGITNQLVTTSYSPPLQSQTSATNQNNENVLVSSPRPFRRRTGPTVAHVKSSTASSYTTGQLTNNRKVSNINTQRRKTVNYFGTQETLNPNDEENQVSNYLDSSDASSELHESNVNSISTISDNNYTPFSFRPSKPIFSFSFDSKTTYTNTDNDETTSTIFESSTIPSTKFTFRGRQFTRSSSTVGTEIPTSTESFQFNNRNKFRRNRFEISTPETIIESSSINSLKSRGGSRFRDGSTKRSIEEQSTFEPTTSKYSRGFGRTLEDKTTQDSVIKFTFPQYSNSDTTTTEAPTDSPILKLSVKTLPRFNARSETDSEHPDKKSITESQIFYVKTTENPLYNTDIKNDDEILNNEFSISGGAIRHASEKHSDDLEKASNIDTTQFPQNILNPLLAIDLLEKDGVTDLFPTIDGSTDYPTTLEFSSPETTRFSTTASTSHRPTHTTRTAIRRRPYLARSTSTTTRPSTEEHRIRNNELSHRLPTSTTPKPTRKYIPNRGRGTVKYDDTTATTQATTKEQLLPIYRESIYNYDGQDNYNSDDYEQATEAVRRPLVTRRVVTRRPTTERTTTEREANERRNFNSVRSEFNRPPSRFAIRSRNRVRTTSTSTTETYPEDEFNSQTESPELFSTQTSRSTRPRFNPFRSKTTESINSEEYVDSQTSVPETFTPQTIRTTRPRFKSFRLRTTDATTSEEYNNSETESSEPISSQESSTSFPRISSFRLRTTESYSDDTDPQTEFTETDVSQLTTSSLPRFSSFRLRTTDSSSSYASLSHTESPEAVTSETQRSTRPRFTSFRRRTTSEAPLVSNEDINDEYDQSNGSVEIPVSSTPLPRSRFSLFRSRNQLRSGDQLNESNNEQLDLSNNSNESVDSAVTQSSTSYRPTFRRRNGYRQRQEQSSVAPISEEINSSSTKSTLNRRRLTYRRSTTPTPDTNLSLTVAESRDELQSPDEQSNEEVIDPVTPPIRRRKVIRKKKILKNPTTSGDIESTPEIEVASSDDLNSELKSSTEPINSESPIDETTPVVLSSTTKRRFRKIIRKLRPRLNEQKQNETVSNEDQSNEEVKPLISTTRKGKSQDFDKIAETSNEVTIPEEESTTLDSQVISSTTDETTSTEGRPRSKLIGHRGSYNPRDRLRTSSPTAASTTERAPSIRKFTRKYNSQAVSSTENENSENDTSDESEDRNVPSIRPISELSQTNRLRNTYRPSNRFANTGSSPRDDDVLVRRPNFNIYNRGNRFNQNENEDNDENNDEEEFNDNQQSNEDEGLNDLNDEEEEDEAGFQARPPSPATSRYPSFRPRFRATPTPSLVRSSTRSRFRTTTIRSISDETGSSPRTRTRGYRRRPTTESSPVAQQDRELNVNALNARNKKIFNNRRFTSTTPSTTVESHTTNIDDIATTLSLLDTEHATTLETNSNDEPTNEFSKRLTEHLNNLQAARRSTPKDSLFNTNRNGVRKPLKPTTTTTAKPTTLHHVFAIDYDENSISNDTKSGKFNSTDDSFESGEVISKHLVKLAEVNRIVEIYSQQEKYKLNTNSKELSNKFDQSNLILEKEPTLDKLGEVHRLTLIKVKDQSPLAYTIDSISSLADYTPTTPSTTTSFTPVRNSIPTFDGKPSENEESASEKRARNLLLSDIIFGVETSTLPVEALFNEADRKAKKLESDSTVNSVTETELPTTITTEMPDESGKDTYVRPPVPLLRPESQELAPLVISIANLDRVILTKASPQNETSDGNRIQDSQNEINSEDETTVATTESIDSRTETTFEATTTVDTTTIKSNKFIPKKRQGRPTFRPAATRRPVLSIRKPSTTKLPSYEVTEISESNESIRGTTVPFVATTARRIRPSFQVRRKTTPVPTTTEIPETTTKISIRRRYPRPTEHRYSSTIRTITSSEPSVSSTTRPRIQIYRRKYPGRTTTPGIRSSTVRTTTESQLDYTTQDFDQTLQPSDNKFSKNRYNQIGESIEDDVVNAIKTISKAPLPAVSSTTIRYRYPVIRGSSTVANAKESDHHQDATESIVAKRVLFNPTTRKSILRRPYLNTVTSISSTTVSSIPVISTTINSIVSQPLRSKRPKAKPFEKTETTPTVRQAKYEPVNNDYDYYDDEQERVISKSNSQVKVVLHGRGLIECLDQGNFPHPISCRKFISCAKMETGGVVGWEYTCPKGLSYDPVGGICNWSAGVGCKD